MNGYEESECGTLSVIETERSISVTLLAEIGAQRSLAVASADFMFTDDYGCVWWVSRVKVTDSGSRRKGYGSCVLSRLLRQIDTTLVRVALVAPGGYDLEEAAQRRFYERNGFVADGDGPMVWRARASEVSAS